LVETGEQALNRLGFAWADEAASCSAANELGRRATLFQDERGFALN
jgi:hypothetical protein